MKKVFAEIGFGNGSFFSTEFEEGEREYRVPKLIKPGKIEELYLRIWIFRKVFILSTRDGFVMMKKDRNKFKFLFGIGGQERM